MMRTRVARLWARSHRSWHDVACPGRLGDAKADVPAPLRQYLRALNAQPAKVVTASASVVAAAGDALAQLYWLCGMDSSSLDARYAEPTAAMAAMLRSPPELEDASPEIGLLRLVRFSLLVGGLVGVAGELWFRRLLAAFPGWSYHVALRTVFDQALFAPAALVLVTSGTSLLASHDLNRTRLRLKQDVTQLLGTMWTWWGGGVAINYLLVPTPLQPPFAAGLAVLWTSVVSLKIHRPLARDGCKRASMDAYLRDSRRWE